MAENVEKTVEFQIEDMNTVINLLNDISVRGNDVIKVLLSKTPRRANGSNIRITKYRFDFVDYCWFYDNGNHCNIL